MMNKNTKKNIYCSVIVLLLSFGVTTKAYSLETLTAESQQASESEKTADVEGISQTGEISESAKKLHHMEWTFATYAEPDFGANRIGLYSPQDIVILETNGNGWGRIEISGTMHWVYYEKNLRRIEKFMPLYENKGDATPVDIIQPQLVEITTQEDNWALILTWRGLMWIDLTSVSHHVLLDVPLFNQRELGYPTGCEIVSLGMMINYITDVDVDTLVSKMPRSFDPNDGFRGNPATKGGFTIFPSALLDLTAEYLGSSQDMSGCSTDDLKDKLSSNKPVVVWVNGLGFNVHAICLTGYDERGFYYNDPWTGRKDKFITYGSFNSIWGKSIYDANLNKNYPPRKALSF